MTDFIKEIIIFSGERVELSARENEFNSVEIEDVLKSNNIPYKEVLGNCNQTIEVSFVVPNTAVGLVKELCQAFNQEYYLELGALHNGARAAWFVHSDGRKEFAGVWTGQSYRPDGDYTYDPTSETYYVIN